MGQFIPFFKIDFFKITKHFFSEKEMKSRNIFFTTKCALSNKKVGNNFYIVENTKFNVHKPPLLVDFNVYCACINIRA